MNKCLAYYFKNKEFREECKNMYLDKRARFRATGVAEPDPYKKKPYYESEKKKEYLKKFREERKQEHQQNQEKEKSL